MRISYTSASSWRLCQQQWYYRYQRRLERKVQATAPTLGRILHRYLELFYSRWFKVESSFVAHEDALALVDAEYARELEGMAFAAYAADAPEVAAEFEGLLDKAKRIATRYYNVRGAYDADEHEVLLCEKRIIFPLTDDGIETEVVVDLVTRDERGVWIWEHKSTGSIPPQTRRLKDLQTLIGRALVEETLGVEVTGIMWNYLRTKEPTVPRMLKEGRLSRREDLDSTWEVYADAIQQNGLDPVDYEDVQTRLAGRELSNFFPRHEVRIFGREDVLLRDLITTARVVRTVEESGGAFTPVRNIGMHCETACSYSPICHTVILGGDENDVIAQRYVVRERRPDGSNDAPPEDIADSNELVELFADD